MLYAATIFLSSLLLFLVQPLVASLILPWFGGSAAVWTTCMLFFQCVLLAGYAYAHALNARVVPRLQPIVHCALLVTAIATLSIQPDAAWKPEGGTEPISRILLLLLASVGLPYLLLSSTSPLLQAWFARARPGTNPYRLFAVSNLASLLALIGYPLLVEPFLTSGQQVNLWSWMFVAFGLACACVAWVSTPRLPAAAAQASADADDAPTPTWKDVARWLALSSVGSALLLSVTNHLTQNVASIPLLWLAPLTLYLLSFILSFEGRSLYRPNWFWVFTLAGIMSMAWLVVDPRQQFELYLQLAVFLAGLFVACMFCHGELYRQRPATRHLTAFYLWISVGGALGGLFVAVVAPLAFNAYYELGIVLSACAILAAVLYRRLGLVPRAASLGLALGVIGATTYDDFKFQSDVRLSERNFYGVLRVKEYGSPGTADHLRRLLHGTIMHGEQVMHAPENRTPTTYYRTTSGIGRALAARGGRALRVGVIGLGVGTLAAYGHAGDVYRFYEINPAVVAIARRDFSYLGDSAATMEISLGDARLNLEREAPQALDVLAVDAFSSDSIPVHLITKEALGIYLRHMQPDGIVAFHVSNRFLDLAPVVARIAREYGLVTRIVYEEGGEDRTQSDWVLLAREPKIFDHPQLKGAAVPVEEQAAWRMWTDDYSNLVQILK